MKRYIVNLKKVKTREEMYDVLRKSLPLPDYCGKNLDALHDVFSEAGYTLEVRCFAELREHLGEYAESFREMLVATDEESTRFRAVIKE